jgi:hypothetical protein
MKGVEIYKRDAAFAKLKQFCGFAEEHDYVEVTEWNNGEGFDVDISSTPSSHFQLTYGQFNAIKKLIKKINKL